MKSFFLLLPFFVCCLWYQADTGLSTSSATSVTGFQLSPTKSGKDTAGRRENPVIPGDFADPSVIRQGQIYYATGTSSEWAPHFPLFQSRDLLQWTQAGSVFKQTPSWAAASFWAPELFYRKGIYYVYYVARKKENGVSCIGVATSKDPLKGFTDHGVLLEFGKEAIDPFIVEENGELYMTWKAYGLDQRPIELLGCRLSGDGLKVEGEPFSLLRDDAKQGLEGQCLVKRNGYYYLFYSVGNCCGGGCSYQIHVARSASLRGPYTRFASNPVLSQTEEWKCTGHGTLVTSKEGKDYFLYYAYNKADNVYTGRQGMLGSVTWDAATGWPRITPVAHQAAGADHFRDEFAAPALSPAWSWDFRHAQPDIRIKGNGLSLSGQTTADNQAGTALTVRPFTGNYDIKTSVVNRNAALKGLVLYGDAGQAVGIGVANDRVQVWEVKKDRYTLLKEQQIEASSPVQLKITVEGGYRCRFYRSENGKDWHEVTATDNDYNAGFLPPWDRSPRPGLMQKGAKNEPAVFGFFEIAYR